jgi:hypothetical protein
MQMPKLIIIGLLGFILPLLSCHKPGGAQAAAKIEATNARTDSAGIEVPANLEKTGDLTKLQYVFKKGDVFGFTISNVEKNKISRDTSAEVNESTIRYSYKFEVLEAFPEGGGRLQTTLLRVQFNGRYKDPSGSRVMEFDSDKKNDKEKEKSYMQYSAALNTPFEIVVDRDGKLSDIRNLEMVIKRYMGNDYNTTKAEQRKLVERTYGESALKGIIQLAFQKVENKSLGIDSSWRINMAENIGFLKVQNDAKYTLKGYQRTSTGKFAHIEIVMKTTYVGAKKLDTGQGWATISDFKVDGKGSTIFDMDRMRVASRAFRQSIYMKFYIEPPEELKKVAPEQGKNFWMVQEASVDNIIEALHL